MHGCNSVAESDSKMAQDQCTGKNREEDTSLTTFARISPYYLTLSPNITHLYPLLFPLLKDMPITEALPY